MLTLVSSTAIVPLIAKADTVPSAHTAHLKRAVSDSLKRNNLDTLAALGLDDGDTDDQSDITETDEHQKTRPIQDHDRTIINTSHLESPTDSEKSFSTFDFDLARPSKQARKPSSAMPDTKRAVVETPSFPMSIISPDLYEPEIIGRKFPWGFADPHDPSHCDFVRLKESVFSEWRQELREASREQWYENWRSERLNKQAEKEVVQVNGRGSARTWGGNLHSTY